jgi:steroid delta-isomerase-like uncharacterized protein
MGIEEIRKNEHQFYEAWNRRDWDSLRETVADDAVFHGMPEELGLGDGPEALVTFLQLFVEAFPDHHIEVLDMAIEDDVGAFRTRHTGTHEEEFMGIPASGRRIDFESAQFSHYDDEGKIVEGWAYSDNLEFMQQLGVIPEEPAG